MPRGLFRSFAMGPQAKNTQKFNPSRSSQVYAVKKHENFSRFQESHPLKGSHSFGERIVVELPQRGDLLGRLQFRTELPNLPNGYRQVNGVGYRLIKHIRIIAQDTEIFNCDGRILFAERQLKLLPKQRLIPDALSQGYRAESSTNNYLEMSCVSKRGTPNGVIKIDIPWCFGDRKNNFPYFPICAIKNRRVRIDIDLRSMNELVQKEMEPNTILNMNDLTPDVVAKRFLKNTLLEIEQIQLDMSLRNIIKQKSLLLRTQTFQFTETTSPKTRIKLDFNNIVTGIIAFRPKENPPNEWQKTDEIIINNLQDGTSKMQLDNVNNLFFNGIQVVNQGVSLPDSMYGKIIFKPGFINASRLYELHLQTDLGKCFIQSPTIEFYNVNKGFIVRLFMD